MHAAVESAGFLDFEPWLENNMLPWERQEKDKKKNQELTVGHAQDAISSQL